MGKAVVSRGPQGEFELVDVEKPRATAGHVVVRIVLRAVNPWERKLIKLKCAELESADPSDEFSTKLKDGRYVVPGSDGVGYVEEVGDGVTKVKVGQRVVPSFLLSFSRKGEGSWQDYVVTPEDQVFAVPASMPDEIAAQFIINPWTAYSLLKDIGISEGEYLLQTGAGSVLGRMVIQLAKHWGIKTINIVRRDDVKQELKDLGADEVINSTTENVVARVKEITGGNMADCAVDSVGGILTKIVVSSVKTGGRVLVIGSLGGGDDVVIKFLDLGRVKVQWWNILSYITTPERTQKVAEDVIELLESKVITPLTGKTFKMEDFRQAIEESEKHSRGGKVLLAS